MSLKQHSKLISLIIFFGALSVTLMAYRPGLSSSGRCFRVRDQLAQCSVLSEGILHDVCVRVALSGADPVLGYVGSSSLVQDSGVVLLFCGAHSVLDNSVGFVRYLWPGTTGWIDFAWSTLCDVSSAVVMLLVDCVIFAVHLFAMLDPSVLLLASLRTVYQMRIWLAGFGMVLSIFLYARVRLNRWIATRILEASSRAPRGLESALRRTFESTSLSACSPSRNHTHGSAAATRRIATDHAVTVSTSLGLTPYFYQMSRSDQSSGYQGSREWFWAKDCGTVIEDFSVTGREVLVLIDVDYYVDMPCFMAEHVMPYYIHTLVPEAAAAICDDFQFTFLDDGNVKFDVSGGGHYVHPLWDYSRDVVVVSNAFRWAGYSMETLRNYLWPSAGVYTLEKRRISKHRSSVLASPLASWSGPWALLTGFLDGSDLKRLDVRTKNLEGQYAFARVHVSDENGFHVSTASLDSYAVATIKADVDSLIRDSCGTRSTSVSVASVQGFVQDRDAAVVLANFYKNSPGYTVPSRTVTSPLRVFRFAPNIDLGGKAALDCFMPCFIDAAYAPLRNLAAERQAIIGRVINTQKEPPSVTTELRTYMRDFVSEFRHADEPCLIPVDIDEVYERQPRPTQRKILDEGSGLVGVFQKIKTFIKAEAYGKVTDPRIISTVPADKKLLYSRYAYSMADFVTSNPERFPWYAFGKTPVEIAELVSSVCMRGNKHVDLTDAARLDGTVNIITRELEQMLAAQLFAPDHLVEFLELHSSTYLQDATFDYDALTGLCVKYLTRFIRLSGEALTAFFNTIWTAFCAYVALRRHITGFGTVAHRKAWASLGGYGGDDGITGSLPTACWTWACEALGIDIELDRVNLTQGRVSFLSRIYSPDVWTGSLNSVCDVPRILSKLHTTPVLPDPLSGAGKLLCKIVGLAMTDIETPVIGEICKVVMRLADREREAVKEVRLKTGVEILSKSQMYELGPLVRHGYVSWWAQYSSNVQYPNEYEPWMDDYIREVGIDVIRFRDWVGGLHTLDEFMTTVPLIVEPKPVNPPPAPVVVQGEVYYPTGHIVERFKIDGVEQRVTCYDKFGAQVLVPVALVETFRARGYSVEPVPKPSRSGRLIVQNDAPAPAIAASLNAALANVPLLPTPAPALVNFTPAVSDPDTIDAHFERASRVDKKILRAAGQGPPPPIFTFGTFNKTDKTKRKKKKAPAAPAAPPTTFVIEEPAAKKKTRKKKDKAVLPDPSTIKDPVPEPPVVWVDVVGPSDRSKDKGPAE
jgi:hypothetical protein